MNRILGRSLSLLLAVIFAATAVSCASNTDEMLGDSTAQTTAEESTLSDEEKYNPNFEAADYDGYEFIVLINGSELEPNVDFNAEELNGDVLNDAIYNRDVGVEEKFNIKLNAEFKSDGDTRSAVAKAIKAGDTAYDMVEVTMNYSISMAANGYLTPIDEVPNIDLSKPYWNQITLEGSSLEGRNYFAYSDLNIHAFGATPCVIFNKAVLAEYNLGDIYALVTGGTWTMDEMCAMISTVTHDLNGDGQLTKDDYWGLICNNFGVDCLISGSGYNMILKDENDVPYLNIPTETFLGVIEGVRSVLSLNTGAFLVDRTSTATEAREYWTEWAITEDRALFWIGNLKCVERLRSMETDFGIVPMPKYNELQEQYTVHRQANVGATIAVPYIVSDPEMVGTIIEELSYRSYCDVMPVYMSSVLEGKFFRDPESSVTLQIMHDYCYCNLGFMCAEFDVNILSTCRDIVTNEKDAVSTFEKNLSKYEKGLDKLITAVEKLDDLS